MGGSVFPSITGALINGIGTNILAGGDTKKGLLMNAALLAGSKGLNAAPSALSNANAGANLTAVPAYGVQPFQMAAPASSAATGSSTAGIFANPTAAIGGNMGMTAPGPSTGLIGSNLNQSNGFFRDFGDPGERFKLGDLGKFAQQNPYLTQMGMQSAQQMMQQPEAQFAPAGQIQRGGIQDVQIASALPQAPRISLI
jgi:hypothetical protein